jgi:AbrB family looped-hinge helix DNA binding protein
MRMTSKGQVTIPKNVRDKLGLKPGDDEGFREEGQAVILENVEVEGQESKGERVVRMLADFGRKAREEGLVDPSLANMTTDEYMNLIRGYRSIG